MILISQQLLLVIISYVTLISGLRVQHEGDSSNPLSIGGTYIPHGECPWLCPLLQELPGKKPQYFCGTSLITNQHVLTGEDDFGV